MLRLQHYTVTSLLAVLLVSLVTALAASLSGFSWKAVIALSIFFAEISATLLLWEKRLPIALFGVGLLFLTGSLTVKSFVDFANLDVIFFLIGMMTLVGILEEKKLFEYIVSKILFASRGNGVLLVFALIILSGFLAALVDEVTSIIITTSIIVALTRKADVSPIPLVMLSVFATNIGSSATAIGNPVGVLIAFRGGISFEEFLRWATPISFVCIAILFLLSLRYFRRYIYELTLKFSSVESTPVEDSTPLSGLSGYAFLFVGTLITLAIHRRLEEILLLSKNSLLLAIPFISSSIAMLLDLDTGLDAFIHKVDWATLVFFALLFASVGALDSSGFIETFSQAFTGIGGDSLEAMVVLFSIVATLMSAFMDNVLATSVLLPVVERIGASSIPHYPFYWISLFAATIGGNLTFIGSTANIVALSILEKSGYSRPSFREWLQQGWWATLIPLSVAVTLVYVQIPLMP